MKIIAFISIFISLLLSPSFVSAKEYETAFDRIIETNTLRCGYYVFPPVTYRDPNTKELSGFTVDLMNEIGRRSGLKIEWAEEIGFTGWTQSLKAKRFDVACTPNWPDIAQSRVAAFSIPMFYAGLYPMVRTDDSRFKDNDNIGRLNSKDIIFSLPEAAALMGLVDAHFPKAKKQVTPPGNEKSSYVMDVLTGKADVFLTDRNGYVEFNRYNDGKLKLLGIDNPIKLQPFNLAVERNEMVLKDFLDNAILDLLYDGTIDVLLKKWEPEPGITYIRDDRPYKSTEKQ